MLKRTTAQSKVAKLRKRVRIVRGGTSASKTFTIIPMLIDYAINNPGKEISITAESIPHLKRGAIRDFLKIMEICDLYNDRNFNKSSLTYHFPNGSFIEFFSADQPDKLRGARRDVLFVNECNNVVWEAYYQMAIRTREFIYLDYNPVAKFWVDRELLNDKDTDFVVLTYLDNEALDVSIVKEIEKAKEKAKTSEYWANWWSVYGEGKIGNLEGVIFKDWQSIDSLPKDARYLGSGLDFGYTNDPTTLIDAYKYNGEIIFDEVIYQTGLMNNQIANKIKADGLRRMVYADSAEPKSIDEIKRAGGVMIKGARKGKDSIVYGIGLLQENKFKVTKRSVNLIKELRNYTWDKDREGNNINKPISNFDHCIDAMRYFAIMELSNRNTIIDIR